jgi:hypothetical protein
MGQQESETRPIANLLKGIDDETMKSIMEYFHFEDYDDLVRYTMKLGVGILPRKGKL